jgi:hypothetical protein
MRVDPLPEVLARRRPCLLGHDQIMESVFAADIYNRDSSQNYPLDLCCHAEMTGEQVNGTVDGGQEQPRA